MSSNLAVNEVLSFYNLFYNHGVKYFTIHSLTLHPFITQFPFWPDSSSKQLSRCHLVGKNDNGIREAEHKIGSFRRELRCIHLEEETY